MEWMNRRLEYRSLEYRNNKIQDGEIEGEGKRGEENIVEYRDSLQVIASSIKKAQSFYVLTGAGISTESGIPDFRSPGTGLWEKIDPMEYATTSVLKRDPETFYKVVYPRFANLLSAQPNKGHLALTELEEKGYLKGIITQNIDGLHNKAGSRKVWEVHGHTRTCLCVICDREYPLELISSQIEEDIIPPLCRECNHPLRPNIVLFGDPMSLDYEEAYQAVKKSCDFLLVVGSSLTVFPVSQIPSHAKKLAIINIQPTGYDDQAVAVIREKAGKTLTHLLEYF